MNSCLFCLPALLLAAPALSAEVADRLAPADSPTVIVKAPRQARAAPASPDVFGTVALAAGVTEYGARWRRVAAADLKDPRLVRIAATCAGLTKVEQLARIHAEVGRQIAWRRDLDVYRISDYWAQAAETLDRGAGDSEDIAVVKMQALRVAGFHPRDLYLSVGRDKVRGADTLLLVRLGDRFYALDDRSEAPVEARNYGRFVPVITLGKDSAWLHGKRFAGRSGRALGR